MIYSLTIKNFKSIKSVKLACKKINVFIGEPNSGKSNIIEALALQSQNAVNQFLNKDIFRYKSMGDLFYDFDINTAIEVHTEEAKTFLQYAVVNNMPQNCFYLATNDGKSSGGQNPVQINHDGSVRQAGDIISTNVRYYEYKRLSAYIQNYFPHLTVPYGDNLPGLLLANSSFKNWVTEFLKGCNLTLTLKPTENDLAVSKFINGQIYSYPYFTISETLQRVIFYKLCMLTNRNSLLLLDEPESNTFPFYTKFLGESIALDESNQYFITTHNPYLLLSLIEKSPMDQINVCIVSMKDYETNVQVLNEDQLSSVVDLNSDVFFNFDKILAQ